MRIVPQHSSVTPSTVPQCARSQQCAAGCVRSVKRRLEAEWQRSRKSSGTAGFREEWSWRKYMYPCWARTCVNEPPTPQRVAGVNTPSVSNEFLGESHRIGHGGVLVGAGAAIAGEKVSDYSQKKSRSTDTGMTKLTAERGATSLSITQALSLICYTRQQKCPFSSGRGDLNPGPLGPKKS
jgi:hypothetical protein